MATVGQPQPCQNINLHFLCCTLIGEWGRRWPLELNRYHLTGISLTSPVFVKARPANLMTVTAIPAQLEASRQRLPPIRLLLGEDRASRSNISPEMCMN